MNSNDILDSVILLVVGTLLLRIAGKKSIAQMTHLEIIIILAIGTTMGHVIKENKLWQIVIILSVYILFLIIVQKLQLRFRKFEQYFIGQATLVIHNGEIIPENLKKLRITNEQLEMRLRRKGIAYISDVKVGTVESNGDFGYELMPHAQPITKQELYMILNQQASQVPKNNKSDNIFEKVVEYNK
ncbi:DUF421 domain-containing protein [Ammoniphilus sp. YIM 78166]|uniref:DUF421 domain-containing protein n=1 Tax=Ammoniphilus sp. YIM 78166 TaxID=1644106 RepID=UPI0010700B5B|nr:YetF domain-containing protein [Ammoniphilus sp. YIM 78166]